MVLNKTDLPLLPSEFQWKIIESEKNKNTFFLSHNNLGDFKIDFKGIEYRRRNPNGKNDILFKALGLPALIKKTNPSSIKIVDATLGLAEDFFYIYQMLSKSIPLEQNFKLIGIEQNAALFVLLHQALQECNPNENGTFIFGNSLDVLPTLTNVDVIYLDPMFPDKKKSALPRKEMQIFKTLLNSEMYSHLNLDATQLLENALQIAKDRVVVKRPIKGPSIESKYKVNHSFLGSAIRYDMYLAK